MNRAQVNQKHLDALAKLFNTGVRKALDQFRAMLSEEVTFSIEQSNAISPSQALKLLSDNDSQRLTMLKQAFVGPIRGDCMVALTETDSLELVRILLKQEEISLDSLRDMEEDVLREAGNIMLNGCVGSMANQCSGDFDGMPVTFHRDIGFKLLKTQEDRLLMTARTRFSVGTGKVAGVCVFSLDLSRTVDIAESLPALIARAEN